MPDNFMIFLVAITFLPLNLCTEPQNKQIITHNRGEAYLTLVIKPQACFFFFPPQLWQENILLQSQIAKHHLWKISFSLFSFIFLSTPTTADRQTEAPV